MTLPALTINDAKVEAKRLAEHLRAQGREIGHGQALEQVARRHGFRDWNTFRATLASRRPEDLTPGARVRGRYLSQPFTATVKNTQAMGGGWTRLTLDLDAPVDVVTFASFSSLRRRITGTVGPSGASSEKTSDGHPHLDLHLDADPPAPKQ